jgi:hypothetical protein
LAARRAARWITVHARRGSCTTPITHPPDLDICPFTRIFDGVLAHPRGTMAR